MTRWVFPARLLLGAAPICTGDVLPLLDWPEHLAIASILRHYGDPAWQFQQTFEIDLKLRTLFEAPTLAELALVVEELMIAKVDSLSEEELAQLL